MKQQKLPFRLFASALALSAVSLGLLFGPARTISSTPSQQGGIYTDAQAARGQAVYYITRTQMPFGAGNTLSNQQYIDTVAYMLKANGYKGGTRELPADPAFLKQIKIEPQGSLLRPVC